MSRWVGLYQEHNSSIVRALWLADSIALVTLVCSHSDPSEARSPSGKSRGYPRKSCSQWVLRPNRVGPTWGARKDVVKSRSWRLTSWQTIKQVLFILAPGTRGISPPDMCPEETQLLGFYAMLIYIFITFPRNAYHSNGFSENSLVCVNVLQSLGVLRSSCSLLISVVCILVLPRPKGIIQESLILKPSQLFTKNQDLFWLCNDSDHLKW